MIAELILVGQLIVQVCSASPSVPPCATMIGGTPEDPTWTDGVTVWDGNPFCAMAGFIPTNPEAFDKGACRNPRPYVVTGPELPAGPGVVRLVR